MYDKAPQNRHRIASALYNAHSVVERRVGIGTAQRLAERRKIVVILILTERQRLALNGLLRIRKRDFYRSVRLRRGGQYGKLQRVVSRTQISARQPCNVPERLLFDRRVIIAQTSALVRNRLFECGENFVLGKTLKLEHPASRHNCGRHRSVRIFRSRTDKNYRALFDGG